MHHNFVCVSKMGMKPFLQKENSGHIDEPLHEVLMKLFPTSQRWRIEVVKIICTSEHPVSSYSVTRNLNKLRLKTSISSVHSFFNVLVESGLCYRDPRWEQVGRKCVTITRKGKEFYSVLALKLCNERSSSQ